MNRRNFLRGMLVSATAGTALVKLATPEETQMLVINEPVAVGNLETQHMPHHAFVRSPEIYMRHHGVFLCVGMMTALHTHVGVADIVSWDGTVTLMPGLKRGELLFEGQG